MLPSHERNEEVFQILIFSFCKIEFIFRISLILLANPYLRFAILDGKEIKMGAWTLTIFNV